MKQAIRFNSTIKPWYLIKTPLEQKQTLEPITYPHNTPNSIKDIIVPELQNLGLTDIKIFDQRPLHKGLYILSTGKSALHCSKSFVELNKVLKDKFPNYVLQKEGIVNPNDTRKAQRRLERRNINSRSRIVDDPRGDKDSWVMIHCKADDGIFINMITEQRRQQLNLEELWAPDEEKYLYERKEEPMGEDSRNGNGEEGDILSGLRRLAYQRRHFSTTATNINDLILQERYEEANEWLQQAYHAQNSLLKLEAITEILSKVKLSLPTKMAVTNWKAFFDNNWPRDPSKLNEFSTLNGYWLIRLKFLTLLNTLDPINYDCTNFINDYFLLKKSMGCILGKKDLVPFLRTLIAQEILTKEALDKRNKIVVDTLKLFNTLETSAESNILSNTEVMSLLLQSMVEHNPPLKLDALHEVVDHICSTAPKYLSSHVIVSIVKVLIDSRDWNKLFQFWDVQIPNIKPKTDYRPWARFIELIVDSGEAPLMQKLIIEDHLLNIKRYGALINENTREQLNRLFKTIDPEATYYKELKDYLLQ